MTTCRYCDGRRVVPVLDKNIENSPRAGNKYRQTCLSCGRWLPMTSEDAWKQHAHPHILPDGEPSEMEACIPLSDYDYADEWADLAEKAGVADVEANTEHAALTDGGQVVDDPAKASSEPPEPEPENVFPCPGRGCDVEVTGFPDSCPNCGTIYDWTDVEEAENEAQ